jgi:hypothetical protein
VATVTGTGHWYKSGRGLVPVRRVFVADRTGTHRAEYFFTTDPTRTPAWVITTYTRRRNLETNFQECRSCLGLETTRGWCRTTGLRAAPCLFGLYSVVAALYAALPADRRVGAVQWPAKAGVTFSDALTAVRRWLRADAVFPQAAGPVAIQNSHLRCVTSCSRAWPPQHDINKSTSVELSGNTTLFSHGDVAMTPDEFQATILESITLSDILRSAADLLDGRVPKGNFQEANGWRVRIAGREFDHRPLIALAAERTFGRELTPADFDSNIDNRSEWWLENQREFDVFKL